MTVLREVDYSEEMKQSFIDYAMKTITDRALPDVRDGLKPVHRRILYGMKMMGLTHDKPHKKSARIVGDVMGKYHPHGDSSVYHAMVRLSQDFSINTPLVDGHGNFGSIDGDEPAAMRYTEARLSKVSQQLLHSLEKNIVDYQSNYDETEYEPVVLPAQFPNLLVNGSEGIATGMATSIPTHHPSEVSDAWMYVLKAKKPTVKGIMKYLSAPEFPKGGIVVNEDEVKAFYETGIGRLVTRGHHHIEDIGYGRKNIVFTTLPVKAVGGKTNLINHLIDKVNKKVLDEVTDIRDESSREGTRLVIEVRKGTDVDAFVNKLWVKTNLQDSQRLTFLVLVDGQPKVLNVLEYFNYYIEHQKELITREAEYDLSRVDQRLHLLEGYLNAYEVMDAVIDAVRGSKTAQESKRCLTNGDTKGIQFKLKKNKTTASKFNFSDEQADAILSLRLQKLVSLEKDKLEKEVEGLKIKKKEYEAILSSDEEKNKECLKQAKAFKKEFSEERLTEVTTRETKKISTQKKNREVYVSVDKFGMIKLSDKKDDTSDRIQTQFKSTTNDKTVIFTSKGMMYQIKNKDIPEGKKSDNGKPIQLLVNMDADEDILLVTSAGDIEKQSFLFISEQGKGKLVKGEEFTTNRTKFLAAKRQEDDTIVSVLAYNGESSIAIKTFKEKEIDIKTEDISVYGRNAIGSYVTRVGKSDRIIEVSFK